MTHVNNMRDVLALLPEEYRGELIENHLYVQPGPSPEHEEAIGELVAVLRPRYHRRSGAGWHIQTRPGLTLPEHVKVPLGIERDSYQPDVAGWRGHTRESLQFDSGNETRVVPDWICEVQSTNRAYDWDIKKPAYARLGVRYLWMVDPTREIFEAFALSEGDEYISIALGTTGVLHVQPFPELALDLATLWPL
jgi:Uma2 family endonuclease